MSCSGKRRPAAQSALHSNEFVTALWARLPSGRRSACRPALRPGHPTWEALETNGDVGGASNARHRSIIPFMWISLAGKGARRSLLGKSFGLRVLAAKGNGPPTHALIHSDSASLAATLLDWVKAHHELAIRFGRGVHNFTFILALKVGNQRCGAISFMVDDGNGLKGYLQFAELLKFQPFDAVEHRSELMHRFRAIDPTMDADNLERYPTFRAELLADAARLERFQDTVRWIMEMLRWPESASTGRTC